MSGIISQDTVRGTGPPECLTDTICLCHRAQASSPCGWVSQALERHVPEPDPEARKGSFILGGLLPCCLLSDTGDPWGPGPWGEGEAGPRPRVWWLLPQPSLWANAVVRQPRGWAPWAGRAT